MRPWPSGPTGVQVGARLGAAKPVPDRSDVLSMVSPWTQGLTRTKSSAKQAHDTLTKNRHLQGSERPSLLFWGLSRPRQSSFLHVAVECSALAERSGSCRAVATGRESWAGGGVKEGSWKAPESRTGSTAEEGTPGPVVWSIGLSPQLPATCHWAGAGPWLF